MKKYVIACVGIVSVLTASCTPLVEKGVDAGPPDVAVAVPTNSEGVLTRRFPYGPLPANLPASNYQDNNDNTITDKTTGLIWEKDISSDSFTQANAKTYCDNLVLAGQSDWRLPSRIELASLINSDQSNPASTFPNTPSDAFWSSTLDSSGVGQAWFVDFDSGFEKGDDVNCNSRVRCVR